MSKHFYLTTTLPYINADPHIGFALEMVQGDIISRYNTLRGNEVFLNTGTDEHGLKIFQKAQEAGVTPQEYADGQAACFKELIEKLNVREHNFVRTTNEDHKRAAQAFWKVCAEKGDIYKKEYKVKYCVGCELEKTDSELVDGKCELHPNNEIEIIEEENYFFRFSNYQDYLLKLYDNNNFVLPESRLNEIKTFVEGGLQDFSISRLKEKMPWGVPVPGDDDHVMYVWFDALVNYISVIGWPDDQDTFNTWWPVVQVAGKDNLRQQSAMWQAMLASAGLPPSKHILIHGFVTSGGKKMSKSVGNVINPLDVIEEYGADALRYYLAREMNTFEDGDFTIEQFRESYNANLANGLGNLVSRTMKMATTHVTEEVTYSEEIPFDKYMTFMDSFELQKAADLIWEKIAKLDTYITETEPFKTIKEDKEKAVKDIIYVMTGLYTISCMLEPFMPETSQTIKTLLKEHKVPEQPLFKRLD